MADRARAGRADAARPDPEIDPCSVARTLAVVGERWTLLVLREAFYGVRRFADIQARLGVARNLLAARLATLVEHGILVRSPYRDPGSRVREEYRLTDRGRELFPILVALMQWGDAHLADPTGPSVLIEHRDCGRPVRAELRCTAGHKGLGARDTRAVHRSGSESGPGRPARC
ncbi:winged helix-turn-helix transcriptional regulator [Pseudonocardia humida]|uniref:Helix-turn-helix transcriptional regulator n=1 Tax=Pseudonocardia humida TaxID=2800819 RepID=A0ABT1A1W5_9PSEU|nr:helix-turn-helix domain-containing protein [Pseudonocardia humida]MCO1656978.1 helix-turn-helix transcriptional regulator [Pseudonocardia humida]